jgi:spore germination protein YaaH
MKTRRLVSTIAAAALTAAALASPALGASRQVVGFYVPWDSQAQAALAQHVNDITVFAPQWINLSGAPGAFNVVADDAAQGILQGAKRPPKVMPLITNTHDGQWDAQAADAVLLDPAVQAGFAAALATAAEERGFAGYVLDFETLSPQGAAAYPALVAALRAALAPHGKAVWVTAEPPTGSATLQPLEGVADMTVVMAYDQCWTSSTPGPIAGLDWLAAGLASLRGDRRPGKILVALGSYAYDWPQGGPAKVLSIAAARDLAQAHGATITRASPSMNATFDYVDDTGRAHHVWMADAPAVTGAKQAVAAAGFGGWGLWRLGLEDPLVWTRTPSADPAKTVDLKPPHCEPLPK